MKKNNQIQKSQSDIQLIAEKLHENNYDLQVGDIFIVAEKEYYHELFRIKEIKIEERVDWSATKDKEANPSGKEIMMKEVKICYEENKDWELTEWRGGSTENLENFIKKYGDYKLSKPVSEYIKEAKGVISSGNFEAYKSQENINADEALVSMNSKEGLQVMKSSMEERRKHVAVVKSFINYELKKKRFELERLRDNLGLIVQDFQEKVEKLTKIIYSIELYLGIREDIVQLQEGKRGDINEIIYFRQEVLFMDEEFGDPGDEGIDFKQIEVFDEWLVKNKNYNKIIPEQKSIVVFKVRRKDKDYCLDNPWINAMMNAENHKSYILIRNGDNIFRIWANITIDRLFPKKSELMDLQIKIAEEKKKEEKFINHWGKLGSERTAKEFDDTLLHYKQQVLMLQGLLDRTEVFHPIPEGLSLLNVKCHDEGKVRFIYDDEMKLPDSRKEFWDWHAEINESITFGSRVILSTPKRGYKRSDRYEECERYDERYNRGSYDHPSYNIPEPPVEGIYSVEKYSKEVTEDVMEEFPNLDYKQGSDDYRFYKRHAQDENGKYKYHTYIKDFTVIKYNPKDEIRNLWDYWDDAHERKNKLSYKIYPDDGFILNYDKISLEDIEFYLTSRVNRRHYLSMMPLLISVKKLLLNELEWEKHFVRMILDEAMREFGDKVTKNETQIEAQIWGFIKKWKDNIKWKRPISQSDEKALKYVKSKTINYINKLK